MKIEVSNGEIIDKLTIIQIKLERIHDAGKVANLKKEYEVLSEAAEKIISKEDDLFRDLYEVNAALWGIEDTLRDLERKKDFGTEFIESARSVYFTNDKRAEIKKKINLKTGSNLIEEKSYKKY
ncbi:MAG: hypothetical protein JW801_00650 [Bacteroidales bacterium]|nr:hypothetical protein [Bacteroidales bacterium]